MATLQQVVQLVFDGVDNASQTTITIANKLEALNQAALGAVTPLADVTAGLLKLETATLVAGAALVKVAINDAGQFQSSFNFITTLFDATGAASQKFRQDILEYAQTSTQSIESINAALQSAIGQGIAYSESLKLLAVAEQLAVAQGGELEDTTRLLVGTLNAYGLTIDEAGKLSDVFSVTIRDGAISIAELAGGLSEITPIAAAVNVGVDQIGAALAVLTANGVPANAAITGVRNILEAIIKPTDAAAKVADQLGIEFNATTLQSKGLASILEAVRTATGGNVETMAQLFTTTEGLQTALSLTAGGGGQFRAELEKMGLATGATSEAFTKMADNIALGSQKISNAIQIAFINLGTPLLDEFSGIQQAIATIFNEIGQSFQSGPLQVIVAALEQFLGNFANQLTTIAQNIPAALAQADLSGFLNAINAVSQAISNFIGAANLDTVEGLAQFITDLGNGFNALTEFSIATVQALGPLLEKLIELGRWLINLDPETIQFAGTVGGLALAFTALSPILTKALIGIQTFGGAGGAAIGTLKAEALALGAVLQSGGLATALGTAGIAGAVGVLAFEITRLTGMDQVLNDVLAPDWLLGNGATLGTAAADVAEAMGLLGPAAQTAAQEFKVLPVAFAEEAAAAQATRTEINAWLDAQEAATKKAGDTKAEMEALTNAFAGQGYAYDTLTGKVTRLKESFEPFADIKPIPDNVVTGAYLADITGAVAINGALVKSYEQVGGGTVKATGAFKAVGDSASDSAKKVEEVTKKSDEFLIKMEEIASNERIKLIEARVELNIAELEADTKKVEAAFDSINTTIESTGDVLGDLYGLFGNAKDSWSQLKIESWIDEENARRDKALEMQNKLIETQIEQIKAKTDALNRGDALIRIDGSGLAPQLEAFMWEVLKAIRVRVNAEFADFLLGVT